MSKNFDEIKAAQAAAYFLKKSNGTMHHLKLIKLMYLAERECFSRYGRPITYDDFYSLPRGPVLSTTLDLLKHNQEGSLFDITFSKIRNHKITLQNDPGLGEIPLAEQEILAHINDLFGGMDRFDIVELTHLFPEWKDPHGSRLPIPYADIMRALNFSDQEIKESLDYLEEWAE